MISYSARGRTTITEVAISLALNPSQVEHLATILEESNMIKVKYALIDSGKTELISKEQTETKNELMDQLRQDIERMKTLGLMINKDIDKIETDYKSIEHDVSQWMVEAEGTFSVLKSKGESDQSSLKQAEEIERIAKDFEDRIMLSDKKLNNEAKTIQDRFKSFNKRINGFKSGGGGGPRKSKGFGFGRLFKRG
ncbi:MAG: hypothetical protein ABIG39_03160 [Candidatus Micrarchaeota archaeon]